MIIQDFSGCCFDLFSVWDGVEVLLVDIGDLRPRRLAHAFFEGLLLNTVWDGINTCFHIGHHFR